MELGKLIKELREERDRIDRAIQALESVGSANLRPEVVKTSAQKLPAGRRGRKTMTQEERVAVSERMRRYWAQRRAETRGKSTS